MENAECIIFLMRNGDTFLGYLGWVFGWGFTYLGVLCWLARGCNFAA